ncbi:ferredoxin [Arthrobacter sp. TWP1-1]|uniref:ferredoxin n=1 Tax=Arthrobacter sp. TWP1-1 TaxID=2804568 RepID=UPI003CFB06BE
MSKNLHIDWIACDGRGLCSELLPALLGRDEWGYPLVREPQNGDGSNLSIAASDEAAAADAVQLCPVRALRLDASHQR